MIQDSRRVPHKLHSALQMAAGLLGLPLTGTQLEARAVELTGPVRALIAEAVAAAGDDSPAAYAVAEGPFQDGEFEVTQAEGCQVRVGLDVDLDSPAAVLAEKLRTSQYDVTGTEVPNGTTLDITVRPGSLDCWRWWLGRLGVHPGSVTTDGDAVTGTGQCKGVTVRLRGDGVPELLADRGAARLMGLIAEAPAQS